MVLTQSLVLKVPTVPILLPLLTLISNALFQAALALVLFMGVEHTHAFDVPANDGFVTDTVGVLSLAEDEKLENILQDYRAETSNEIAIVILQNLYGEAISDIAVEIGRSWGVGSKKNNGVIILISYETRDIFLATGYGLEGAVPDIVASGIAERDIAPYFREGKYAEGLHAGITALQKHIGGEYTADRYAGSGDETGGFVWLLFIFFMFFEYIAAWFAKSKSWWAGGVTGGILGLILATSYAWWLSIPLLTIIGLVFDYILSKKGYTPSKRGGGFRGPFGGGSRGGSGGFGGGSFGGGGGGSKW